jgi:hypothetical protein
MRILRMDIHGRDARATHLSTRTLWSNLGHVLDGCDGGAVAAKYSRLAANLKIRTGSRKSPERCE